MPANLKTIFWFTFMAGFTSMAYYLALCCSMPLFVVILVAGVFGIVSFGWFNSFDDSDMPLKGAKNMVAYLLLAAGVAVMMYRCYGFATKYGEWDAWAIWNYRARYLVNPQHWRSALSLSGYYHPSYPLFVPSLVAFGWRLAGREVAVIPFLVAFCSTLLPVVMVYLALYRKNILVAAVAMLTFLSCEAFARMGMSQYADMPLAFTFLCVVVLAHELRLRPALVAIVAGLLGCCMWIKNEGAMLAVVFVLFHLRELMGSRERLLYFAAGIAVPLLVYTLFKSSVPGTDLVQEQGGGWAHYLSDKSRYELIWKYLKDILNDSYRPLEVLLVLYGVGCVLARRLPDKLFLMLVCATGGYLVVYLFSPKNLDWHLNTSMARVLLQIVPAMVYVVGEGLTHVPALRRLQQV